MKPREERAPRLGSAREVQKTHRKFASKKRAGIGGHELGQRRMLRGVGSAMLTALRNFLTADEVVITRTCRCHAAPGRSSRRRGKQANTTTTPITWSLEHVISVGLLIIGESFLSLASAAVSSRAPLASTAVAIFSTEAVRHEFAAAALQELQMSVGSFGIGGPSLVLVRQSPGPTCWCTCRTQLSPRQQGATR